MKTLRNALKVNERQNNLKISGRQNKNSNEICRVFKLKYPRELQVVQLLLSNYEAAAQSTEQWAAQSTLQATVRKIKQGIKKPKRQSQRGKSATNTQPNRVAHSDRLSMCVTVCVCVCVTVCVWDLLILKEQHFHLSKNFVFFVSPQNEKLSVLAAICNDVDTLALTK